MMNLLLTKHLKEDYAMKVYITKSTAKRIIKSIDLDKVDSDKALYRDIAEKFHTTLLRLLGAQKIEERLKTMFGKYGRKELLAWRLFMEDSATFINEKYVFLKSRVDTYTSVNECDNTPAYHYDCNCQFLKSDFKDYEIPDQIRFLHIDSKISDGQLSAEELAIMKKNVESYRNWWKAEGQVLYMRDKGAFLARVNLRFQPLSPIRDIREFEIENSGVEEIETAPILEILEKVDKLVDASESFKRESEKNKIIVSRYAAWSKALSIQNNETEYSDEEVRLVLREYEQRYKEPLRRTLRELYRRINNPDLETDVELAHQLGLKYCRSCLESLKQKWEAVEDVNMKKQIEDIAWKFIGER